MSPSRWIGDVYKRQYLGCENEHWRQPLLDKFCSQVFIHYRQTKDIKNNEELWDTRLGPGMPSYTKKINS